MSGIDLLPWRERRLARRYGGGVLLGLVLTALGIWLGAYGLDQRMAISRQQTAQLRASLAPWEARQRAWQVLRQQQAQQRQARLQQQQRAWPARWMQGLAMTISAKVRLTALQAQGGQLELGGEALEGPALADYLERLRAVAWWGPVQLRRSEQHGHRDGQVWRFQLRLGPPITASGEQACHGLER